MVGSIIGTAGMRSGPRGSRKSLGSASALMMNVMNRTDAYSKERKRL